MLNSSSVVNVYTQGVFMMKINWNGKECDGWVFDGKKLKPKSGATLSNSYEWTGKELKPASGATLKNTIVWDGKEAKPKSGASLSNTFVIDATKAKPKSGATLSNTIEICGAPIPVVIAKCFHIF